VPTIFSILIVFTILSYSFQNVKISLALPLFSLLNRTISILKPSLECDPRLQLDQVNLKVHTPIFPIVAHLAGTARRNKVCYRLKV